MTQTAHLGGLPLNTPVTQLMSQADAAKLSPNAAKLIKANLLELAGTLPPTKTLASLNITFQDIQTIEDAIRRQHPGAQAPVPGEWSISCCCCTPCCCCTCAAAVVQPRRPLP